MDEGMELIYNEHIADEKLKLGTKYEKLAAMVFKILHQKDVVIHDLKLRGGEKKTTHQIDVTVQSKGSEKSKRILIECKDINKKVGISIVRDFFGAVSQIKPDESFIVTTVGYTREARNFAEDEGIKLALLGEFSEVDWGGRIKNIHLKMNIVVPNTPLIEFVPTGNKIKAHTPKSCSEPKSVSAKDSYFYDKEGNRKDNYKTVLEPVFRNLNINKNSNCKIKGFHPFDDLKYILQDGNLIGIKGFNYEQSFSLVVEENIIGVGEKIALMVFKVLDGTIDKLIFKEDIDKWTFSTEGEVIKKEYKE
ncbi:MULTISPECIES: restriction endonuclease [Bacillus]|uniref:Restriction endonuclease n=1 Tax=Bacillus velezensis TaxID=492670 RepID=A0ABC8D9Z4_BACVE|nr:MULTISPECIES: restriction endonuclease [Bacillus]ANB49268.1 hypothetical protein A1D33_018440 [Bacillus velezensis]AWX72654.1 restriction endonuclease [Bacillus velezensis]MBR7816761.1 restriction endonuclease [Bacillus sp. CCNWLCWHY013]MDK2560177.1 restriction endonuclease [Bacillus amyloliquefaciens]WPB68805.1 restriction endonuclease [Bacillus velezensis]